MGAEPPPYGALAPYRSTPRPSAGTPTGRARASRRGGGPGPAPPGRAPAPQRGAPANSGHGRRRSGHRLDRRHRRALVRGRRAAGGRRVRHCPPVSHRPGAGAPALGAHPRPAGPLRHAGAAVHRSDRGARPGPGVVRPALAGWRSRSRGPPPPRRGDAAAVVRVAIRRTTPALLGLFSLVTLLAHPRDGRRRTRPAPHVIRRAAWYRKPSPTFSDALALVRRDAVAPPDFPVVGSGGRRGESPPHHHRPPDRDPLLRRLKGESRAQAFSPERSGWCWFG